MKKYISDKEAKGWKSLPRSKEAWVKELTELTEEELCDCCFGC